MSRSRKNNADYFPHYKTSHSDIRIVALKNKFGLESYAIWNILLELLTDKDNFCIQLDDEIEWELLAGYIGTDCGNLRQIVAEMVKLRLLQQNGTVYHSQDLVDKLSTVVDKRIRERERVQQRTRDVQGRFGQPQQKEIQSAAESPQTKPNQSKYKENIKRKNYIFFEDKEFTELYDSFLEMRKEKKKPPTLKAEKLILSHLQENSLTEAKLMLERSITNSWTDVFKLPDQNKSSPKISKDNELWKKLSAECGKCKNGLLEIKDQYGMWINKYCDCINSLMNKTKTEELVI